MRIFSGALALSALLSGGSVSLADINETTDRHIRNLYGCQISTTDNIKPEFSERERAWASWMTGLANLSNDGIPEVIVGYSTGGPLWCRRIISSPDYSHIYSRFKSNHTEF